MVDPRNPITCEDVRALDPAFFRCRFEIMLEPGGVEVMKGYLMEDEIRFEADLSECHLGRCMDTGMVELKPGGFHEVYHGESEMICMLTHTSSTHVCHHTRVTFQPSPLMFQSPIITPLSHAVCVSVYA